MKLKLIAFALLATTCLSACGTPFVGIRMLEDGSYMITRTRKGFLRLHGIVERCVAAPGSNQMICQLIDDW